jgi:UDP-glucose 4,6-dehydratase
MTENVLILGSGFVGKNLTAKLSSSGQFKSVENVRQSFLDYRDPDKLREYLAKGKPDYLINASGYTGVPNVEGCETNWQDCYWMNVVVPVRIAKVCKELEIPFINIGSGCIYDHREKIYSEYDMPNFGIFSNKSSFYSKTKHLCEEKLEDLNAYTFRIRIPFCGDVVGKNYLYKLLKYDNLINEKNSVTGLDFLADFTQFFLKLEKLPDSGVYNVVNSGIVRGGDVIEMMREQGLNNPNWNIKTYEEMQFRVNRSNCMLSNVKIEGLGYKPKHVRDELSECIKNFKNALQIV